MANTTIMPTCEGTYRLNAACHAGQPTLIPAGRGLYEVIGASGQNAGWLERLHRRGWQLVLKATPTEVYRYFRDGKRDALKAAERY